ncbi:hypothetical protein [Rhodococcus koreensis]|uniref:Uncharacterized protein n=1 Tax=Rhodococcus koreensis TaxID=99653 RepID=A0A1H4L2Q0_9NOCA|nr:hypothetical protein [Rhodococcus koreensis]SEB64746.1 hypothetical protein SAMN04490239_1043 [Rhodococcus koreensis]
MDGCDVVFHCAVDMQAFLIYSRSGPRELARYVANGKFKGFGTDPWTPEVVDRVTVHDETYT